MFVSLAGTGICQMSQNPADVFLKTEVKPQRFRRRKHSSVLYKNSVTHEAVATCCKEMQVKILTAGVSKGPEPCRKPQQ